MWEFLETYSGAIIAFFTIALVVATVVYIWVTCRLLRQSKNAFLADMVLRMMERYRGEMKERGKGEPVPIMKGWTEGYREAFIGIDKKLGMDLGKLLAVGLTAAAKMWIEETEKLGKKLKEKEEKMKKLEKEIKGNKESGTS